MATNKTNSDLFSLLKAKVLATLTAVGVALGFSATTLPLSSSLSRSTTQQQDPVSPDGHYATWSDYAKSIECKAQQQGLGPSGKPAPFSCSQIFGNAQTQQNSREEISASQGPTTSISSASSWVNNDTHYMSEPINMAEFTERVATAREQMKSSNPKVAYEGYIDIEGFLIAKDSPPAMRRMTTELVGSEEAFYKDYDAAVKRFSDMNLADVQQGLRTQNLDQLSHDQKCAILDPLHIYLNLLQVRKGFRTFDSIKDDQMANLEQQDSWARDLSDRLSNNQKLVCKVTDNTPSPAGS